MTAAQTAARTRLTDQYGEPHAVLYEPTAKILRLVWWPPTEHVDAGQELFIAADGVALSWIRL